MFITITLVTSLLTALWGWRKGFFRLVLRLSVLLLAYAFTWQETPAFAAYLTRQGWLSGLLVWPVAGLVLFFAASIILSLLARGLASLAPEHWLKTGKTAGGIAGAALGCGLGLVLVWGAGAIQDAWRLRAAQQTTQQPAIAKESALGGADQMVRNVSGDAMAVVVGQALGDGPAAKAATQWVRKPLSMSEGLQHLASKPELQQLFTDPVNYAVLVKGPGSAIQRLPSFQALTKDAEVMQLLSAVGLPGDTLPQQSQALAAMLSHYAGNFETMRNTPEFQALVQDPELRAKLQQGNLLALVTDDKMRSLANMLTRNDKPGQWSTESSDEPQIVNSKPPEPTKSLYQWKDTNGRVHITEAPPPEGIEADAVVH